MSSVPDSLIEWLYGRAGAERWGVPPDTWAEALNASLRRGVAGSAPSREVERYLKSLHLEDLALACACAAGNDAAWEHFVREQRPALYRSADALDPGGGARDLADSLYADLYGFADGTSERRSLFRYFHGRSSLSTWLRAVLSQRHVDRLRANRRLDQLPDDDVPAALADTSAPADPERPRYVAVMQRALSDALASLDARDRLRVRSYYARGLTLAETGRLLHEHEATVSRQLARTRKLLRREIERRLVQEHQLSASEITECFATVMEDAGPLNLERMLVAADDE